MPTRIPRPRSDAARNRERVRIAAAQIFAERGSGASLREVAERAGVGVGTVHRHMPDRDGLIQALLHPQLDALTTSARTAYERVDPGAAFADFLEEVRVTLAGSKVLAEVMLDHTVLTTDLREPVGELLSVASALLEQAQTAGDVRADITIGDVLVMLAGMHAVETAFELDAPGVSQRLFALLMDGVAVRRDALTPLRVPPYAAERVTTPREGRPPATAAGATALATTPLATTPQATT